MKTKEQIDELKREWLQDPCWDIYDTEGFEDHVDELCIFQLQEELKAERQSAEMWAQKACKLRCSVPVAKELEYLRLQLQKIKETL